MKILLSAYACEPNKGSEPEIGWKWATELCRLENQVYVITRLNNKENIEKELKKKVFTNLKFIYFDYPEWFLKIFKGKQNRFSYFYFYIWQIGIYFVARNLVKRINFDYIHHVTFGSYRIPSFLCLLNVPFIFGPVAGGEEIPKNLIKNFNIKSKIKEYFRNLDNKIIKISPILNIVFKNSYKIIATSIETKLKIPKRYHEKTMVELAISADNYKINEKNLIINKSEQIFNMCFVGVLEHRKGIHLILEIIKRFKQNNHKFFFNFFGDGPLRKYMEEFIIKENLINNVKFHGKIYRESIYEEMKKNHVLLFPSLRDSGGFVLFEAMSVSLPSIILKIGGPPNIIDKKCGIIIDPQNKTEKFIIDEIYNELKELKNNTIKLKEMSDNCHLRVKLFSWESKIKKIYGDL